MCLLTFIPETVWPNVERFETAAIGNPDGFGFAILDKNKIHKAHSMNFQETMNKFLDMRTKHTGPALFHFRWATHGSETVDNCHPFLLGNDPNTVVAHNGILPVSILKGDERSDTRVFAQDIMPAVGGITSLDNDEYHKQLSEWAKGNKLVFLTNNDDALYDFYIVNEHLGHWDEDMWWSNYSYEAVTTTYKYPSYGGYSRMYGGGWDEDWDYSYTKTQAVYEEEEELLEDKLQECWEKMDIYLTRVSDKEQLLECYTCAHSEVIPLSDIKTHCPECMACLFCGAHHDCGCWDAIYEANSSYHLETTIY